MHLRTRSFAIDQIVLLVGWKRSEEMEIDKNQMIVLV